MKKSETMYFIQFKTEKEWEILSPHLPIRSLETAKADINWYVDNLGGVRNQYRIIKQDHYIKDTVIK